MNSSLLRGRMNLDSSAMLFFVGDAKFIDVERCREEREKE